MKIGGLMVRFAVRRPQSVVWAMVGSTLVLVLLALLPTLWPGSFPFLHPLRVDTDPENMLPAQEPVRVFHNRMKREMSLADMVVLGVVNSRHPDGIFNPGSLERLHLLARYAETLRWEDPERPGRFQGVIGIDLISPSTVESIEQAGPGTVKFEWLMASPPSTREEALAIRERAARIPFLQDTLLSSDGRAIALYIPLTAKDQSYRVARKMEEKIDELGGDEEYFITGLPVAQDTFGVEMFRQMAIAAPAAMLIIFLLLLFFFRKLLLILSPLIVALVATLITMSLLVIAGRTIHIMSSMIPIFIMPIAVLDAVHILSEFFDRYQNTKSRRGTVFRVMNTLFMPMLYTSLTTAVGFASLALTPIPPVQVFGIFIALGVMAAWILTILFIPAFIMFIPRRFLENFGAQREGSEDREISRAGRRKGHRIRSHLTMTWFLASVGRITYRHARLVLVCVGLGLAVAVFGIFRIRINDNPTKWFSPSHPIREADRVLNQHFAGTYMAYLSFSPGIEAALGSSVAELRERLFAAPSPVGGDLPSAGRVRGELGGEIDRLEATGLAPEEFLAGLTEYAERRVVEADFAEMEAWDEALLFLDRERQREEVFKQPEVLEYIVGLQDQLLTTGVVGKSNSLADIVKTVYRELISGEDKDFIIPATSAAVGQTLISYQSSHRPQDLWHFVTPDYRTSVLWLQLKSGDNRDMEKVVRVVDEYVAANPPPAGLRHRWFGLTYINVVWQKKMVAGMFQAFLGSFLIVFLMMTLLYRSALWGIISMIPLTVTIGLIYGVIGLVGKDYDMPVAVLSSLSLGLSVDYSIHFLSRSRNFFLRYGSWERTVAAVFGEPARAIFRNAIVIGVGFLPLLLAPLVPYQTVGIFIAAILGTAGVATLLIQPALITILEKPLFRPSGAGSLGCRCATCAISVLALVAVVAVNLRQLLDVGWSQLSWWSSGMVILLGGVCFLLSRQERCRMGGKPAAAGASTGGGPEESAARKNRETGKESER